MTEMTLDPSHVALQPMPLTALLSRLPICEAVAFMTLSPAWHGEGQGEE